MDVRKIGVVTKFDGSPAMWTSYVHNQPTLSKSRIILDRFVSWHNTRGEQFSEVFANLHELARKKDRRQMLWLRDSERLHMVTQFALGVFR